MRYLPFLFILLTISAHSQKKLSHIDPPFWWADMPVEELQIMLHGENIGHLEPMFNYDGIQISEVKKLDNPNYLIVNLTINESVSPGIIEFRLKEGKRTRITFDYELRERSRDKNRNLGFNSSDVIYLLMPDRFANGDLSNDTIEGMLEPANRSNPNGRHGGDIKGVGDNLDYIKEIGMTAVWLTPTFENDQTAAYGAYHGYAATDLYKVDRRFGSNEEFKTFVDKCHSMDLKVIMDMIHNHVGDQHWWMKDPPTNDWFHDFEKYGQTSFRGAVQSDPHAAQHDFDKLVKGWFVSELADLDQRNEVLADYLIQNSIWWIEYSGVDGIRMDTYVYPYKEYLNRWVKEVIEAYPKFNIVGEAWLHQPPHEGYWQEDKPELNDGFNSHLSTVTDFPLSFRLSEALVEDFGWTSGLSKIYYTLSQDRVYSDPNKNVIFLDNHDLERFFTRVEEDMDLFKMGYAFLMTVRGIPQVYYGTELMMANDTVDGDGRKRMDMPGGWPTDSRSVFKESERTSIENEAFDFVKKLTNWRKDASVVHGGKLTHFVPDNNTYIFFRHTPNEAVMVVMNRNEESTVMARDRFAEILDHYTKGKNVLTEKLIDVASDFVVGPKQTAIFELMK